MQTYSFPMDLIVEDHAITITINRMCYLLSKREKLGASGALLVFSGSTFVDSAAVSTVGRLKRRNRVHETLASAALCPRHLNMAVHLRVGNNILRSSSLYSEFCFCYLCSMAIGNCFAWLTKILYQVQYMLPAPQWLDFACFLDAVCLVSAVQVKMAPKAVSQREESELQAMLERLALENEEIDGDAPEDV